MVEVRETRVPRPRAGALATLAAVGLASIGCTMCPDPFDYSGPVPNGSSPQNDFRARSNGILPLGAAPRPWPLIVQDGSGSSGDPAENTATPTLAEEAVQDELVPTAAVIGESDEEAGADGQPLRSDEAECCLPAALDPVPVAPQNNAAEQAASEKESSADQARAEETESPQAVPHVPEVPGTQPVRIGETPGWRTRLR
jgi:hypothetical protein